MDKKKIDVATVVSWVGLLCTTVGTLASAWSNKKNQDATISKLIDEKLANKN